MNFRICVRFSAVLWTCLSLSAAVPVTAAELPEVVEFNRDIRPILSDNCFFCHGPDKNKRQADLRLDTEAGLLGAAGSAGAVVPGKPDESPLLQRILTADPETHMPPPSTGKLLTADQIQLLRRWIQQGGRYEGHWAFLPLNPGAVAGTDDSPAAVTAKIDEYVDSSLQSAGLQAVEAADRITLIRRLSFDLLGLPPTPEETAAFVADQSPDAVQKLVDRLLESPHFGERMAVWWLDLVRYADSVGYHGDQEVSVSPFRQYVIQSFNSNKPFDQFTVEQLAGDLLPGATLEQKIASGYNRLGMMSAEGGVQDREYLAKYIAERVRNASGTWLGITLGCAECHDHKFDPFTTRDFYRFEAFFADIRERGLYSGANSDGNWGPYVKVPTAEQSAQLDALSVRIAELQRVLETPTPELAAAQQAWEQGQQPWIPLTPDSLQALSGTQLKTRADGAILATGPNPATETYTLSFSKLPAAVTAFRIEVLPDDSLPQKGPGRAGNGNFVLSELTAKVRTAAGEQSVSLQNATATYEQTGAAGGNPYGRWAVAAAIDADAKGRTWGWAVMEQVGRSQTAVFETTADLTLSEGAVLSLVLDQNLDNPGHNIGCFRIFASTATRPLRATEAIPAEIAVIVAVPSEQRSEQQSARLAAWYRTIAPQLKAAREQLAAAEKERAGIEAALPSTLITEAVAPRMVRVLPRGNWMDESGEVVTPALPAVFAKEPAQDQRLNRLDLARWIVAADNPLTARTTVNRLWKVLFGAGLSRRLDDLGAQGEWPSHPQLLDFLAAEFQAGGWNLKQLIRSIVLTRAYQRSSRAAAGVREQDPGNRWLARQGRFRLDAEFVRDNALEISGLLVKSVGGRSVRPYQPAGYWAYLNFPTREWQNGAGSELYRRGLYTHWQRQYLHPSLLAFDAPSREECTADRNRSNTPLQSLVLLNDPTYVEAARGFAERILREGGATEAERISFAFRKAVSRDASADEAEVLTELLQKHRTEYAANPAAADAILRTGSLPVPGEADRTQLAAWTSVARVILNLHEVMTRN
ncbi:MAG: PSD1 and planctomycete cytochrome C domain-containing protein [Planctomycetaceae bacterium]